MGSLWILNRFNCDQPLHVSVEGALKDSGVGEGFPWWVSPLAPLYFYQPTSKGG